MPHRRLTEREHLALHRMAEAKLEGGEDPARVRLHCALYLRAARGWLPRPAEYRARLLVRELQLCLGARLERCASRVAQFLAQRPDLLKPGQGGNHLLAGHCYVAAEALYHLAAKNVGYRPYVLRVGASTHWFLENAQGRVLDPTAAQFTRQPPYELARCCGFLTRQPSRRCQVVLDALRG